MHNVIFVSSLNSQKCKRRFEKLNSSVCIAHFTSIVSALLIWIDSQSVRQDRRFPRTRNWTVGIEIDGISWLQSSSSLVGVGWSVLSALRAAKTGHQPATYRRQTRRASNRALSIPTDPENRDRLSNLPAECIAVRVLTCSGPVRTRRRQSATIADFVVVNRWFVYGGRCWPRAIAANTNQRFTDDKLDSYSNILTGPGSVVLVHVVVFIRFSTQNTKTRVNKRHPPHAWCRTRAAQHRTMLCHTTAPACHRAEWGERLPVDYCQY